VSITVWLHIRSLVTIHLKQAYSIIYTVCLCFRAHCQTCSRAPFRTCSRAPFRTSFRAHFCAIFPIWVFPAHLPAKSLGHVHSSSTCRSSDQTPMLLGFTLPLKRLLAHLEFFPAHLFPAPPFLQKA
jgi:hypothetical protein